MAYTFDPASGATRGQLVDLCTLQSFGAARYAELLKAWLNDAVLEICKRLDAVRGAAICPFDANGIVTQPAAAFFKVNEVWLCNAGATGTTETAIRAAARYPLAPLAVGHTTLIDRALPVNSPLYYVARRGVAGTGRGTPLQLVIEPASSAGTVGIVGLQRPPVMAADTDVTGLGADLDEAVIAFAKARAFRQEDDFEMSNAWKNEFEAALRGGADIGSRDGPIVTPGLEDY